MTQIHLILYIYLRIAYREPNYNRTYFTRTTKIYEFVNVFFNRKSLQKYLLYTKMYDSTQTYLRSAFPVPLQNRTEWLREPARLVNVATRRTPCAVDAGSLQSTFKRKHVLHVDTLELACAATNGLRRPSAGRWL